MKRIILSYFLLLTAFAASYAQDSVPAAKNDSVLAMELSIARQTAVLYEEADFRNVIDLLEKEKDEQKAKGLESAELYYNLGNAYFRVNDLAHARLNYERALLLDPGDRDTRHNIEYLSTKLEDRILVADTFFLSIWFNAVQNLFGSNAWARIAVVSFLLLMGCLTMFFFSKRIIMKKAAFYTGIVLIAVVLFANIFTFRQKSRIEHRTTAIVMAGSAPMVSSPDINSKELTVLHAGTKVVVTKEDRNWLEIEIDNGTIGWIQRDKLEII
jgi:tetratricopeptide (TPR) repeat protein